MDKSKQLKITISPGNSKLGGIPSVSLPACVTCNPDAPCFLECYANKIERIYKTVKMSYYNNLEVLQTRPALYWETVRASASMVKYFRYHVSGDIPGAQYLKDMITTAQLLPDTKFLCFTKQYQIINDYMSAGGSIPENLKIIFSNWGAWKTQNPFDFPVCEVIFKNQIPAPDWKICGGNCTACACRAIGCWELKPGEVIAIYKH